MAIGPDLTQCAPVFAISAFNCGATQHCLLALGRVGGQGSRCQSALPKPPCRPWPRSLALHSHFSQKRTDQIRSMLNPPLTVLPSRRVFGARPTIHLCPTSFCPTESHVCPSLSRTGLPSLGHTVAMEIGRRSAGYPAQGIFVYPSQP